VDILAGEQHELAGDWEAGLREVMTKTLARRWREAARLQVVEREILVLKERVAELEHSACVSVPVTTFAPEPYEVVDPFHAVIQPQGDEYMASFYEANLSASGATREEALANLKDIVVGTFEILTEHDPEELGPGPASELAVLRRFVREAG
jgi:predicted RNase H-like HicB family nuclease